ncbi:MAG: hypothetical protein K6F79_09430 [Saccharofermentans sp.]|nr:hypothetical protein [Saccharofermentans sp.]
MSGKKDTLSILKHNFGRPSVMTWGWPLMWLSLMTFVFFGFRCLLKNAPITFGVTTIVGCSVFLILEAMCILVLPVAALSTGFDDRILGRYTGVGALLLSVISGIPLMMLKVSLYNIASWITLRICERSVFPVFFHNEPETVYGKVLTLLSDSVIPAFGIALFFYGLLWSRFISTDRFRACVIITAAFVLFKMDFTSAAAFTATGIWCFYLRTRVHNIWAPFLCLVSADIAELFLPQSLSKIDIFSVQTYADIGTTYFYSSIPAFFMGMVLLLFFIRVLDSFSISLRHEIHDDEYDDTIPAFDKSINLSLILTIAVFITIWVLIIQGVHL